VEDLDFLLHSFQLITLTGLLATGMTALVMIFVFVAWWFNSRVSEVLAFLLSWFAVLVGSLFRFHLRRADS
jgi:hypothetical protein